MDMELISREDAAWLAAIVEGEGSFMIFLKSGGGNKKYMKAGISVTNADFNLLKPVSELFYKLKCRFYYHLKKTKSGHALCITIEGNDCRNLIYAIRPFLKSKKDQADLIIEFLFWKEEVREKWFKKLDLTKGDTRCKYTRFSNLPLHLQMEYIEEETSFQNRMRALRHKSVNPQRLKRATSQPLEMMV